MGPSVIVVCHLYIERSRSSPDTPDGIDSLRMVMAGQPPRGRLLVPCPICRFATCRHRSAPCELRRGQPADPTCGRSGDESEVRHVTGYHGTGCRQRPAADRTGRYNDGTGAEGTPPRTPPSASPSPWAAWSCRTGHIVRARIQIVSGNVGGVDEHVVSQPGWLIDKRWPSSLGTSIPCAVATSAPCG
jgi:hypothetical protein